MSKILETSESRSPSAQVMVSGSPFSVLTKAYTESLGNVLIRFRLSVLFLVHTVLLSVAYWLAFCLRFDFHVPAEFMHKFLVTLPIVLVIKLTILCILKSFHGWWRYVSFTDLTALARALLISFACIVVFDHFLLSFQIPRVVLLLDMICAGLLLGVARSSWRLTREGLWPGVHLPKDCTGALMITNSHESVVLAHQINSLPGHKNRVVGILSDDTKIIGSTRAGIPVLAKPTDAHLVAHRYGATEIWAIAGELPGQKLRELKERCEGSELKIKIIPPALSNSSDNGQIPIRDIDIRDLLRRDAIQLDTGRISSQVQGRRVMVTGAGGSIGSEICRQLLRFGPSDLVLLDHRENSVFLIHQELSQLPNQYETTFHPCVGDILDQERMRCLFEQFRPEFVYHAAAHKHVGLMERNAGESIKNNIFGSKNVADLAKEYDAEKFVLISTDKAVNPTSVMGATKQIAERYIHSLAQDSESTAFVVVRFGNVLGSNGSVVPIFKKQIAQGGPITVTDERMTRFFMTIPEASQLVLQAASMGQGGEIFVLEMGEQVPIIELAREMIRLAGLPEGAIEIQVVGTRPGEKLFEELYFDEEEMLETDHPKVHAAYHRTYPVAEVLQSIDQLRPYVSRSNADVRGKLKEIIPEFNWNAGTAVSASRSLSPKVTEAEVSKPDESKSELKAGIESRN